MRRRLTLSSFQPVSLDPNGAEPLHRQLYEEVRTAILGGRLSPGMRMPPSRDLARGARISRNTVLAAFQQLLAEGYLTSRGGSGTYVAEAIPELSTPLGADARSAVASPPAGPLSRLGRRLAAGELMSHDYPVRSDVFRSGLPALDEFPYAIWRRLMDRRLQSAASKLLAYGDPQGYRPLREAIAQHLAAARGARCSPDQIVVLSGSQQAVNLLARVLMDPGDRVWFEDPGYYIARAAFEAVGGEIVPVPVDREGLLVDQGERNGPDARAAYVTPSHQHPLGHVMSLARRLSLLRWAERTGAWIIEDDYASEYRYAGRPLAALQGLDTSGRAIYVGTFSKTLFASLRLGYAVLPPGLVPTVVRAREVSDRQSPTLLQAVTADFLLEGHFARHLRRMRTLYAQRQHMLVAAAGRHLKGLLEVAPAEAGMNLVGWLPPGVDDRVAARAAEQAGLYAPPLSRYAVLPQPRGALVLGYTGLREDQIEDGAKRLAAALAPVVRG